MDPQDASWGYQGTAMSAKRVLSDSQPPALTTDLLLPKPQTLLEMREAPGPRLGLRDNVCFSRQKTDKVDSPQLGGLGGGEQTGLSSEAGFSLLFVNTESQY